MISEADQKLLSLLHNDARASISDLSRALGLSRSTVQNRIAKLEKSGVIKGYVVEYGGEYLDELVCAHISIKVKQKKTATTNNKLRHISQITALYAIGGEYDLIGVIEAHSLAQLSRIIDDIGALDGVVRTNSSIIMETKFKR
jgi:DNA-binding Lrp family transcriptional regulator